MRKKKGNENAKINRTGDCWLHGFAFVYCASGVSQAGNENTNAEGLISALDANRGTGVQVNADTWENMDNVLAGDGNQTQDTMGNANTGSGSQDNSTSSASGWSGSSDGSSVNNGSGGQLGSSSNSNGGDRISNDIVMTGSDEVAIASAALEGCSYRKCSFSDGDQYNC